jgi:hypothetical protein|tara:strand:+ start:494 stop:1096 length:603 start_codon:yes stop_codon:yes gene_type:complete
MDFITNPPQQQMQQQFFQNQRYSFGDFDTKKITLFYSGPTAGTLSTNVIQSSASSSYVTATYGDSGDFVFNLVEPIIIDKMSDVFLDSFSMANCSGTNASASGASFGAVLKFDDINQNNFSNNTAINNAELIVLDEDLSTRGSASFVTAKNKKFNYMGVIQPGKYETINGKLTDINNGQWKKTPAGNLVFSIELVISNKR